MKFSIDDPKLTAFVLGELEDDERVAVEAAIAEDQELAAAVDEIRETTEWMSAGLSAGEAPRLSDIERAKIGKAAASVRPRKRKWLAGVGVVTVAASLVVVFGVSGQADQAPNMVTNQVAGASTETERGLRLRATDKARRSGSLGYLSASDATLDGNHAFQSALVVDTPNMPRPPVVVDGKSTVDATDPLAAISGSNTEDYSHIVDNPFVAVADDARSTFSIDVNTASYANVRRFLKNDQLPPKDAVRIEEMVNYFSYAYATPTGQEPFAVHFEVAAAPWNTQHRLVKVGIKGKEIARSQRPRANLVFLIDVSGSMESPGKLPLLKRAFTRMVNNLNARDRIAIVVYAGASGLVLPSTSVDDRNAILSALDRLSAGGSTNGGAGIELAYRVAAKNFIKAGTNRVILATDGDFNVGTTGQGGLIRLIENKAKSGVFLTVLGFGMGNYKDGTLEKLADKGNGNYAYIDTINEAKKVLVEQMSGTLVTIAKDVKIQVEFNPRLVKSHRLIGYENRMMAHRDFNDDKKDAGDIGAGHTVTALYEIVPSGGRPSTAGNVDELKYQSKTKLTEAANSSEIVTVNLRYKKPDGKSSRLLSFSVKDSEKPWRQASRDFKLAAGVAAFGMVLRESEHRGTATLDSALALVNAGKGQDAHGYRAELGNLIVAARGRRDPKPAQECDEILCLVEPERACCGRARQKKTTPAAHQSGTSTVPDKPTKAQVLAAMGRVSALVGACGGRYKTFGAITVRLNVVPAGRVTLAETRGRLAGTPVAKCAEKAALRAMFPRTKVGMKFVFSFRL